LKASMNRGKKRGGQEPDSAQHMNSENYKAWALGLPGKLRVERKEDLGRFRSFPGGGEVVGGQLKSPNQLRRWKGIGSVTIGNRGFRRHRDSGSPPLKPQIRVVDDSERKV